MGVKSCGRPPLSASGGPVRKIPSLEGLELPDQRAIMLGALAVLQGMLTQGFKEEPAMDAAIDTAHQVREVISGSVEPETAIEEWIHLEGKLWLS